MRDSRTYGSVRGARDEIRALRVQPFVAVQIDNRSEDRCGSFTTGWNHQRVQLRPLCSNRYRNGEPMNPTRRAIRRHHASSLDHLVGACH
jgi:hypothetical protein